MHQGPILSQLICYPWFVGWIMNIYQITWVKTPITGCSVIWKFSSCICMLHLLTSIVTSIFEPIFHDLQMLANWWNNWITIIYSWTKVIWGWQVHFCIIHQITTLWWWRKGSYCMPLWSSVLLHSISHLHNQHKVICSHEGSYTAITTYSSEEGSH